MKKTNETNAMTFSTLALVLAGLHLIAAVIAILRLPETVPTHFDIHWVCDGIGSRWIYLLAAVLPIVSGVVSVIFARSGKLQHPRLVSLVMLLMTLYLGALFWMVYPAAASGAAIGDPIDTQALVWLMPLLYASMFIIIGNYLPIVQPNKTLGIRLSWTLQNPQCWRLTHRFAGRLWVVTGLLMFAVIFIALACRTEMGIWLYIILFEMVAADLIVPCVYAWQHKESE